MFRSILNSCLVCILLVITGCQSPSQSPQVLQPLSENENIIELESGERVCNLAGQWGAIYKNNRGGVTKDVVEITQSGSEFLGIKTKGNENVRAGEKTIKGNVNATGFENIKAYHSSRGWINVDSQITRDCNQITVKTPGASIVLTRLNEQI